MFAPKLSAVSLIILAAGCTSSGPVRSLVVASNNTAEIDRNRDGMVTLRSLQTHIVGVLPVRERFSRDIWTLPSFYVIVTNGGKENLKLKLDDIRAYSDDRRVRLLDPAALQDRLDQEQTARGPSGGYPITMRDASTPGQITHEERRRDDPNWGRSRDEQGPAYPQGATAATGGPANSRIEPFGAPNFQVPAKIIETALQPQMIRPGDVGGGRIVLEARDITAGLPLKIVVTVSGEKHEFLFEVR